MGRFPRIICFAQGYGIGEVFVVVGKSGDVRDWRPFRLNFGVVRSVRLLPVP